MVDRLIRPNASYLFQLCLTCNLLISYVVKLNQQDLIHVSIILQNDQLTVNSKQ